MNRIVTTLLLPMAAAAAQDHYVPLGFATGGGPPNASFPVMRAKDQNNDGVIVSSELSAFLRTCFHTTPLTGTCFMTDGQAVVENGEPAFYFTDSEQGRIVRGVDANHNGELESTEVTEFFAFGIRTSPAGSVNLMAPDTLGVWHDPVSNRTRVYVGLDNTAPSTLGYSAGIHRLVDLNNDGDAMDPGEYSLFAATSMGLTVPGNTGPIVVNTNFLSLVRVLPGGKVVAFARGLAVGPITGASPTIQPDQNVFYGFTDNNGTAVPEVWFNSSTLNDLPRHPLFANATFPEWDTSDPSSTPPTRRCFARFVEVATNGFGNLPCYYIGSSYGTSDTTALNSLGQNISGLIYRVIDQNQNQVIDPGELSLFLNFSGTAYAGVNPVSFTNIMTLLPVTTNSNRWWGMSASNDGSVAFTTNWGAGASGQNTGLVTMRDDDFSGAIDNNEIRMVWIDTGTHPFPLRTTSTGGFYDDFFSLQTGAMPGPFPAGVTTLGDGCQAPTQGLKPVMDLWNGGPVVGNTALQLGPIRAIPNSLTLVVADFNPAPAPLPLSIFGFSPACFSFLQNPVILSFLLADIYGRAPLAAAIPANPGLAGLQVLFQAAIIDAGNPGYAPYYTTNALQLVIQP